ncbi:glycerol-3-phosphate ABC transporter ATP-binding protein [Tumebacillus algifaecis]|uniref:Glycerol-3-phosphate ABC transporter ATP-binding protein n=1 Tax=Tumebacillus algifaecis TaxID=1214604 RepID=A0A223CZ54_9BACL|nr:sn-glycerol-3-phosphate ABC transporter ATP-binding protein UgpC [Tumebacillus algifaecis]ASS74347.1 glycerol-3-phosphate ABC transporter ATP-binding protein [Tumebacillus algifaecis]
MARVQLKHVYKRYSSDVAAVKDFDLDIQDKEFLVLVGPSGCGKTTTLRMIAGLEDISDGELWIGDRLVNDVHPKDRDIAMVFQNYALYSHMSIYENMAFGLKMRKVPKAEIDARVREAASILDIEHLLNRKPKALSGGQRQRVALGRAIVREPQVFLMDEPLSNLDAKLRVQMRAEIAKLHHRLQTTVIYVTHDQTEAMTMGTRIVVMKDGIIQQVGTPQEIYNRPDNMFVASFIGSPAMNFLRGSLQEEGDDIYFRAQSVNISIPKHRHAILREAGVVGQAVVLGIRPENLHDDQVQQQGTYGAQVTAAVEVVELLGAESYVYLNVQGQTLIARVPARSEIRAGSTATLSIDTENLHIFHAETEQTIY